MTTEIETLRLKKEMLKEELQIEGQKEKNLQEDIQILKEKIEIQGLERTLDAKRESVRQLAAKKGELQGELNQSTPEPAKVEESKESTEPSVIVLPDLNAETVEAEPEATQQPQESDSQKKRRWF